MTAEENNLEPAIVNLTWLGSCMVMVHYFVLMTYNIRLIAIREFGTVIHEFDPYFNYRATEYLHNNGVEKFFTWYDYKSWYPIGRPIGTTIYPGMQFTATFIKNIVGESMSLNDICCYIPAWFGVIASILVGLITYECTLECNTKQSILGVFWDLIKTDNNNNSMSLINTSSNASANTSKRNNQTRKKKMMMKSKSCDSLNTTASGANNGNYNGSDNHNQNTSSDDENDENTFFSLSSPSTECAISAMGIMGMVPAHLTRSIGGGFDNESVAMSAMCLTFYFWVRSLRANDNKSYLYGAAAGVAYFYMVATWGGYVFVLNMIGLHAAVLVLLGRFSTKIYISYSAFYIIGTFLATQVPVVGMTPLKSLEQLGPLVVFFFYQLIQYCESKIRAKKLAKARAWKYRFNIFVTACIIGMISIIIFIPTGYFGPISSRVRGLFVKHTKTGNPLVDSVAEHQPADSSSYFRYLQHLCTFAPIGFIFSLIHFGDASSFVITFAVTAYFFSLKMMRLILLMGPVASILGGITVGRAVTWSFLQLWIEEEDDTKDMSEMVEEKAAITTNDTKKRKKSGKKIPSKDTKSPLRRNENSGNEKDGMLFKRLIAALMVFILSMFAASFQNYCLKMSRALSNPSIAAVGQRKDGSIVKVDDYREAYWWLRDNTPEDARILAWWDYGYQITSIANRTTIADGNTWNHEHIALLGKILTTNADEGYNIARHLADYVLIWAGGGGDDLAKSPHLARIANSVYRGLCPDDPTCSEFGFVDRRGTPSVMMEESFLYKLHSHRLVEGVEADIKKFEEVYRSKYGKVRIFKLLGVDEGSKSWVADPRNHVCDVPGSWFCRGQYPPALTEVLQTKQDFSQLEDFNRRQVDSEYQEQYFENLNNPKRAPKRPIHIEEPKTVPRSININLNPSKAEIAAVNSIWEDTEETTELWKLITSGEVNDLKDALQINPLLGHIRSSDGRGPMFWAFENRRQDMVKVLMKNGVSHSERDKEGLTPVDLLDAAR